MSAPAQAIGTARALGDDVVLEALPGSADLADVREALDRLQPVELALGDVRAALGVVAEHAAVNPYAALTSRHQAITRIKGVTRKVTFFVAHNLAVQVTDLAHSLLVAVAATADRIELLEAENVRLRAELDELRRRVEGLGAARSERPGPPARSAGPRRPQA